MNITSKHILQMKDYQVDVMRTIETYWTISELPQ